VNKLYVVFIVLLLNAFVVGCGSLVKPESEQKTTEQIKKSVVRIRAENREGTGFVVGVSDDKAYIVTVSHVVEGDPKPTVEFFENNKFEAEVLDNEAQENGLALLSVKGLIPYDVMPLYLVKKRNLKSGDALFTIGFPKGGARWAHDELSYYGKIRRNLIFSGSNEKEGNSGSPVIKGDQVVAIITSITDYAYAISAENVRDFLDGAKDGRQVIDNMEKWDIATWHKSYEARLRIIANIDPQHRKLIEAEERLRVAERELAELQNYNLKKKLDAAKQNRKQAKIEVTQARAVIETAKSEQFQRLSRTKHGKTKHGKFMSRLDHGDYIVVVGSYDSPEKARRHVKNIRAKYPELFYPQIGSSIPKGYKGGIYLSVNKRWRVYIGGLYTADSARKLRNYAIKKLHGFRKDIYVTNIYPPVQLNEKM